MYARSSRPKKKGKEGKEGREGRRLHREREKEEQFLCGPRVKSVAQRSAARKEGDCDAKQTLEAKYYTLREEGTNQPIFAELNFSPCTVRHTYSCDMCRAREKEREEGRRRRGLN